jgi:hypothetical protein
MDLAVSEDADLLIGERALYSVGIVSEVFVCELVLWELVILLWEGGLWLAWEVLGVECLEIILVENM